MALTRDFKETFKARVECNAAFRKELLREAVECFLPGDIQTAKAVLRNYINATVGFVALSDAAGRPLKSVMRMLGPSGNPQARNLVEIVGYLQREEGVSFQLKTYRAS